MGQNGYGTDPFTSKSKRPSVPPTKFPSREPTIPTREFPNLTPLDARKTFPKTQIFYSWHRTVPSGSGIPAPWVTSWSDPQIVLPWFLSSERWIRIRTEDRRHFPRLIVINNPARRPHTRLPTEQSSNGTERNTSKPSHPVVRLPSESPT